MRWLMIIVVTVWLLIFLLGIRALGQNISRPLQIGVFAGYEKQYTNCNGGLYSYYIDDKEG